MSEGPYRTKLDLPEEPAGEPTAPPPPPPRAPTPLPSLPSISSAQAVYLLAIIHARHPWLTLSGIVVRPFGYGDVVDGFVAEIASRSGQPRETFYAAGATLAGLDAWVVNLWNLIAYEYLATWKPIPTTGWT